ncbi:uncharacterized protein LOC120164506 isoform X4 [Hibiscus syriacus]|uniref:uncharacterized protein LOC120164506 isoform X3 n=1 Tax=Hibiscus syriacus TaxID=106335 RepID=UPI001923203A|nr:uncharacterized protein LOC120164506 isoform X3 [Hibiscus syriacus]XP_039030146.1 uncharacterized protein LOC120164506 isoform X4 [Hibiscus syriacus]
MNTLSRQKFPKRGKSKTLRRRMKRLRSDMEEISEEQGKIKEGQRQVRVKFEAVEMECEQLRRETNMVMQQSMSTQLRLAFMFQILKARENQDFNQAAQLTAALRELIAREKA